MLCLLPKVPWRLSGRCIGSHRSLGTVWGVILGYWQALRGPNEGGLAAHMDGMTTTLKTVFL